MDKKKEYFFHEKVRLINKEKFVNYYEGLNIGLQAVFGDYNLNNYKQTSDRLILIFKKYT